MTDHQTGISEKAGIPPVVGATLWMAGTLSSFMLMAVSGRELSDELNTFQILFWRSAVSLVVISALLSYYGWQHGRTQRPGLQVVRNVIHFGGQFGWFFGISAIPLAEVSAIEFTVPIWTLLLASLLLGERITRTRTFAVVMGFAGTLIILRPGFSALQLGQFSVLAAALFYATTNVLTKRLVVTDTPLAILLYMSLVQFPLGLVAGLPGWSWPSPSLWIWIFLVGVSGMSAHYCLARALKLADASVVVPLGFLRLPLSALIGFLAYTEAFDLWIVLGAIVIFIGNYFNIRTEARGSR